MPCRIFIFLGHLCGVYLLLGGEWSCVLSVLLSIGIAVLSTAVICQFSSIGGSSSHFALLSSIGPSSSHCALLSSIGAFECCCAFVYYQAVFLSIVLSRRKMTCSPTTSSTFFIVIQPSQRSNALERRSGGESN